MAGTSFPMSLSGAGTVVAAGTTQATGPVLGSGGVALTTAAGQVAATLPVSQAGGVSITVYVPTATSATIFPPPGGTIMALAADAAFTLATTKVATFTPLSATAWAVNLTA